MPSHVHPSPSQLSSAGRNSYFNLLTRLGAGVLDEVPTLTTPQALKEIHTNDPHHGLALILAALDGAPDLCAHFGHIRLSALVWHCLDMDPAEAQLMSALAGDCPMQNEQTPAAFNVVLHEVLFQHCLRNLFCPGASGNHHRGIVPTAYNERTGEIDADEMARWRADFRAMVPERQIMAATIIWLYQCGPDSTWLRRVPCTWPATEALHCLRHAGCLSQWLRLMAAYPGW